jgi:hypothetical protein
VLHFKIQVGLFQKTFGGIIQKQSYLATFFILIATLFINACSSDVSPPKLNRPLGIPYEACNNSDLDLRHLTESAVRNFIDCINGPMGQVQAYKNFLDELSSKELEVLLRVYNTHMVNEARFKKGLSLYHKMLRGGEFDQMMQAFASMNDYGVLQKLIPLFKNLYGTNGGTTDPAVEALNQFLVKLIDRDQFTEGAFTVAKFMDNGRSRLITKLLTRGSFLSDYNSDRIVDELSNAFYFGVQTGGFKEISILLYDPMNYRLFQDAKRQSPGGTAGINAYLEYLALNSQTGPQLTDLVKLTRATNRSAQCFTQSGKEQQIDNLFAFGFEEVARRNLRSQEEIAEFYLEEVPFHLQNLKYQCNLPSELTAFYPSFTKVLKDGYGSQLTGLEYSFHKFSRLDYLSNIMSSTQLSSVFAGIANTSDRDLLAYFLDMLTESLEQKDFYEISQIVNYLVIEDLGPAETNKWLKNAPFMDENLRGQLLFVQESADLGLIELLQYMDTSAIKSSDFYAMSAKFRTYLGSYDFVNAPANYVLPVIQKLVSPNGDTRDNIKSLVHSLLDLWASDDAGLGDFMAAMANSMEYSKDRPIQEFIRDVLSDKEFVAAINPILLKLVDKESFIDAISLTAELGRNGELARLLGFLHSLSESLPLDPLDPEPLGLEFEEYNGNPEEFLRDYSFTAVPLKKDYKACEAILKYNSNWDSSYVRYLAECFSADSNQNLMEFIDLLDSLKVDGHNDVLDILGAFASQDVLRSVYFYPLLDSIENMYSSGELDLVFDFLHSMKSSDSGLLKNMETMIRISCENENELSTPNWLIGYINEDGSERIPALLPELLLQEKNSQFPSVEFAPLEISDADLQRARQRWDELKDSIKDQSWRQDEEAYWQKLLSDFRYQSSDYFYSLGIYPNPADHPQGENQFHVDFLRQMLAYTSRGESVWALVSAVKSLEQEGYPWVEFFEYSTMQTQLIPYYVGKDKKPMPRFASLLERAEILVQNSRLGIASWVPSLGVEDIGTFFQLELARSNNLGSTLNTLKAKIDLGLNYTKIMGRKRKHNHLRNIDINFEVLEALEEQGLLRFFAKIYKHLVEATPAGDRVQDAKRNYASLVHEPMKLGIFSFLTKTYQQWKQVGLAEDFVLEIVHWLKDLSYEDVKELQDLAVILWELEQEHQILAPLYEVIAESPLQLSDQESLDVVKAISRIPVNFGFIKPVLLEWKKDPSRVVQQFSFLWNQVLRQKQELVRVARVVSYWDVEKRNDFVKLFRQLSSDKAWVLSAWKELDQLLQYNQREILATVESFQEWRSENQASNEQVQALTKLLRETGLYGKPIMKAFLEKAENRRAVSLMTCEMAKQQKLEDGFELLEDFRNSKGFENVFEMLRRYFTK